MPDNAVPIQNNSDTITNAIVKLAIESWRFSKVFEKIVTKLDAGEQSRFVSQLRWFNKKIEEALSDVGLKRVNIEGHPFDPGLAATPLNIQEFESNDKLFVEQMIEPIIMGKEGLVRTGTVILKKVAL